MCVDIHICVYAYMCIYIYVCRIYRIIIHKDIEICRNIYEYLGTYTNIQKYIVEIHRIMQEYTEICKTHGNI